MPCARALGWGYDAGQRGALRFVCESVFAWAEALGWFGCDTHKRGGERGAGLKRLAAVSLLLSRLSLRATRATSTKHAAPPAPCHPTTASSMTRRHHWTARPRGQAGAGGACGGTTTRGHAAAEPASACALDARRSPPCCSRSSLSLSCRRWLISFAPTGVPRLRRDYHPPTLKKGGGRSSRQGAQERHPRPSSSASASRRSARASERRESPTCPPHKPATRVLSLSLPTLTPTLYDHSPTSCGAAPVAALIYRAPVRNAQRNAKKLLFFSLPPRPRGRVPSDTRPRAHHTRQPRNQRRPPGRPFY
jgi:hypothetical protein